MDRTNLSIPPEFDEATGEQRIAFVQALWDRIAQDLTSVPVPDIHKQIIDARLDAYRADPQPGQPWSEVRERLLSKLSEFLSRINVQPAASAEANEAARWYEARRPGLGTEFILNSGKGTLPDTGTGKWDAPRF